LRIWREDSPLLLRPQALPGMWRWGLQFLSASRAAPWWRATEANLSLGLYSVKALRDLRRQLPLEYHGLNAGTLKIFRDADALADAAALARSLAPQGLQHRMLSPEEAVALEPALEPVSAGLVGAIHYPDDESGDAHLFTRAIEREARRVGVEFRFGTTVTSLKSGQGRIMSVESTAGELGADVYILAAASCSTALAAPLGLKLPIHPVKGYSATLRIPQPERPLGVPLVDFEQKLVITPLGRHLRIAGTAEFAGFDGQPNPKRSAHLLRQAARLLPDISATGEVTHWNGLRPMTADGPPILGATPYPNLFLNAGHGPLGWTLGAGSSRAVADLAAGREPEIDLAAYSLARFGN
jgi:D-amino-acid dehydrogenase